MADEPGERQQREAQTIADILHSMGIERFEPRVVLQLLELQHRYATTLLRDARDISAFADKNTIDEADLRVAVQEHRERTHVPPPSKSALMHLAAELNTVPLAPIPADAFGVHLGRNTLLPDGKGVGALAPSASGAPRQSALAATAPPPTAPSAAARNGAAARAPEGPRAGPFTTMSISGDGHARASQKRKAQQLQAAPAFAKTE